MIDTIWCLVGLLCGLVGGYLIGKYSRKDRLVGTLRVDRSDPDEAPYLFMEIEHGGIEKIERHKEVTLRVDLDGYLPRK